MTPYETREELRIALHRRLCGRCGQAYAQHKPVTVSRLWSGDVWPHVAVVCPTALFVEAPTPTPATQLSLPFESVQLRLPLE
jgi:ribosomal protein S27AE